MYIFSRIYYILLTRDIKTGFLIHPIPCKPTADRSNTVLHSLPQQEHIPISVLDYRIEAFGQCSIMALYAGHDKGPPVNI